MNGISDRIMTTGQEARFFIGVAGESFPNDDGSSRQEIIARLKVGATCVFVADPAKKFDKHAIKAVVDGKQIGFVPREMAKKFREYKHTPDHYYAEVAAVNRAENGLLAVVLRVCAGGDPVGGWE